MAREFQVGDRVRFNHTNDRVSAYNPNHSVSASLVRVGAVGIITNLYTYDNSCGTHSLCDVRLLDGREIQTNVLCVDILENV